MTDRISGEIANLKSDRRAFLAACGKYSATVPPVMTALLSTSLSSPAIAKSGGGDTGIKGGADIGAKGADGGKKGADGGKTGGH
ncbi:hypothetical protein [Aurantiacibacter spongiae]|uniref:Uncharacterized protein n=1 Tax=Aurantiacibacter spongiae TaxID=2488860 RepID=A0A3N5CNQ1_9SPHN|nr:hypothetical protein [Aurantiacibacter spongiae]RPF70574.1 hypothetical protein EG799_02250 [Aurantiacibacter spongiae]